MKKSVLLLPLLLIAVTGCVVTYGNFPDVRADALPKQQVSKPVSYYIGDSPTTLIKENPEHPVSTNLVMTLFPNLYPLAMKDWRDRGRKVIGKTLETSGMFSELLPVANPLSDPTHKGMHIDVTFAVVPPSDLALTVVNVLTAPGLAGIVLPPFLLFAYHPIPYYSGEGGLTVRYRLYRERGFFVPYAAYEYTIKKKGWGGILLLPFAWLNFLTDDLKDALRATTLQFLIDAQRDGNL